MKRLVAIAGLTFSLCFSATAQDSKTELPGVRNNVQVEIDTNGSGPHEMQEVTRQSVARAYANAWGTLARSMPGNRADMIDEAFLGAARDQFAAAIQQQSLQKLSRRYVDHGHKIKVLSYSPEGGSVQILDHADMEVQFLDGDSVIYSERQKFSYVALLSPTEVTWKVRLLQAVPD
ncbi:MAG TPA: hypothetical protein VG892_04960 [Terriglobales bacterium]|nr:hypothetical protein [Terriglobales bacterium]